MTKSPRAYLHESFLFVHSLSPEPPLIPSKTLAWQSPKHPSSLVSWKYRFPSAPPGRQPELGRKGGGVGQAGAGRREGIRALTTAVLKLRVLILSKFKIKPPLKFYKACQIFLLPFLQPHLMPSLTRAQ